MPPMASSRIQRWALALSTYQCSIRYKSGVQHANADEFSHLPSPQSVSCVSTPGDILSLLDLLSTIPITVNQIKGWTDRDPVLARVRRFIKSGWPSRNLDDGISPYQQRKYELSVLMVVCCGELQVGLLSHHRAGNRSWRNCTSRIQGLTR